MGGLFYPCSVNKCVDQLLCNREADLRLCFRIYKSRFSHEEAHGLGAKSEILSIVAPHGK